MRRFNVVSRPEAVADLEEVFRYVLDRSQSPGVARRFVGRIRDRCRRIGDAPFGGVGRDDLAPGVRPAAFERRAVIACRAIDGVVEITNIVYGDRDYEALFRDRDDSGTPAGDERA